jgi:predicted metal-dependent hydrolase
MLEPASSQLPLWSERDPAQPWVVRQSQRARRLAVRVYRTGRVEVVVPPRTSRAAVEQFVAQHREWIERKRAATPRPNAQPFPPPRIELAALDEVWRVHSSGGAGRLRVATQNGLLVLTGVARSAQESQHKLRAWLMQHAAQRLGAILDGAARELGFRYERLSIRRQRTRWGSCSARGTISLNCCVLFQTPQVLRYLLVHELVHTRHMNHSARFWAAVAERCPDYRRLDRELLDGWRRVPSWVFAEA